MEILFENNLSKHPLLSIVLLDWSVRESYHVLDYLNNQTVQREQYEIIWIEYYDRRPKEIEMRLKESAASGKSRAIDKWVVMGMPDNVYYHKHLMYNVGVVVSKGRIVTFMDSDAVVSPTFVGSIIKSFDNDNNIVLHMDQVRNMNKKFYPFNYPSIEEVMGEGCINLVNGKPRGLVDRSDPMHLPNYGSCMSAMRDDLISIGGADEHIDYLGHICGPYEMTFRLVNAGKREIWHTDEWLYHTWHPGQAGDKNYAGPHDGRHMSQTALSVRRTGRIFPLVENPAIRALRLKKDVSCDTLLSMAVSEVNMDEWVIDERYWTEVRHSVGSTAINLKERSKNKTIMSLTTLSRNPLIVLRLYKVSIKIFLRHVYTKIPFIRETLKEFLGFDVKKESSEPAYMDANPTIRANGIVDLIHLGFNYIKYLLSWHKYVIERCWRCLHDFITIGIHEVAVFGIGDISQVLYIVSKAMPIKITAIYDSPVRKKRFMGYKVLPLEAIKNYSEKVIIASFDDVEEKAETLKRVGINSRMIVDLW